MGFGICGLEDGVSGSKVESWGSGLRVEGLQGGRLSCFGLRAEGRGSRVWG